MKIALLGGSFNPLHIGHAMLAETVIKDMGYDRVLFVPTCNPPHKQMNTSLSAEKRFEMVKAFCDSSLIDGKQYFFAEDCEIKRGGISYTSDTLEYITEKYAQELDGTKPAFIMGQEVASQFYKWRNPEKVASLADLLIAHRHPDNNGIETKLFANKPSGNYTEDYSDESYLEHFPYAYKVIENPVLPVSSTEIRARIATGRAWRYLVPEAIFGYIVENNLYSEKNDRKY